MSYFIDGVILAIAIFSAGVLFGAGFCYGNKK
jgi:hypothetical protein